MSPSQFYAGDEASIVTPTAAMATDRKRPRVKPVVLCTFHRAMFTLLRGLSSPLALRKSSVGGAVLCNPPGRGYTVVLCPVGASGTVLALENVIALGAASILFVGWCGSLDPACPMCHVIVPTTAVREEGTSFHYLPADMPVQSTERPTAMVLDALYSDGIPHSTGCVWTTDAPYRETPTKVRRFAREGVRAVDMETSAIFALAAFRGCDAAGALVVSDELFGEEWNPGWQKRGSFKPRLLALCRAMLRCCNHLANSEKAGDA